MLHVTCHLFYDERHVWAPSFGSTPGRAFGRRLPHTAAEPRSQRDQDAGGDALMTAVSETFLGLSVTYTG